MGIILIFFAFYWKKKHESHQIVGRWDLIRHMDSNSIEVIIWDPPSFATYKVFYMVKNKLFMCENIDEDLIKILIESSIPIKEFRISNKLIKLVFYSLTICYLADFLIAESLFKMFIGFTLATFSFLLLREMP